MLRSSQFGILRACLAPMTSIQSGRARQSEMNDVNGPLYPNLHQVFLLYIDENIIAKRVWPGIT